MRLKNFSALILSGAMIAGTIGAMNPVSVLADGGEGAGVVAKNTYTMTVPADLNITKAGWNELGNITITKAGEFDSEKTVTVAAESKNGFKLVNGDNNISYALKTEEGGEAQTSFDFTGENIVAGNALQAIGVDVTIPDDAEAGKYTDTINYTATMSGGNSGSDSDEKANINDIFDKHLPIEFNLKDGTSIRLTYTGELYLSGNNLSSGMLNSDKWDFILVPTTGYGYKLYIDKDGKVTGDTSDFLSIRIDDKEFWRNESSDDDGKDDDKGDIIDLSGYNELYFEMYAPDGISYMQLGFTGNSNTWNVDGGSSISQFGGSSYPSEYGNYFGEDKYIKLEIDGSVLKVSYKSTESDYSVEVNFKTKTFKATNIPDPDKMISKIIISGNGNSGYGKLAEFTKETSGSESGGSTSGDSDQITTNGTIKYIVGENYYDEGYSDFKISKNRWDESYYIEEQNTNKMFEYAGLQGSVDKDNQTLTLIFVAYDENHSITLTFDFSSNEYANYTIENNIDGVDFSVRELTIDGKNYEVIPKY